MRVDWIFDNANMLTMDAARPRATTIDPQGIAEVEVLATVVGGHIAHDRIGLH